MIIWTEHFQTGSPELDQQHRLLIDNINQLEPLLRITNPSSRDIDFAFGLVEYLEAYANLHFQCEEACMEQVRCAVRKENCEGHRKFQNFISEYKSKCEKQGYSLELLRNLHRELETWICQHIGKIDVQLKKSLAISVALPRPFDQGPRL